MMNYLTDWSTRIVLTAHCQWLWKGDHDGEVNHLGVKNSSWRGGGGGKGKEGGGVKMFLQDKGLGPPLDLPLLIKVE